MSFEVTKEEFLKDVSRHQMVIHHDDGIYRHLRFGKPDSGDMHFDLITYPGYLVYSGDMGCYVFSRIHDMFQFFRNPDGDQLPLHRINPHYWMEKVEASCRDGMTEFSHDKFIANLRRYMDDCEVIPEARADVEEMLIDGCTDSSEEECVRAAMDYEYSDFRFQDFWEVNNHEYAGRFIWCCYAIVWGIAKYDEVKK